MAYECGGASSISGSNIAGAAILAGNAQVVIGRVLLWPFFHRRCVAGDEIGEAGGEDAYVEYADAAAADDANVLTLLDVAGNGDVMVVRSFPPASSKR